MKKFAVLLLIFALSANIVQARDYAKLQEKELKHAQKYGTTNKYFSNTNTYVPYTNTVTYTNIKDPKIMKLGNYETIPNTKYNEKLKADETKYKKIQKSLTTRNVDNYNAQAKGEDYYKIYRIAEKMIRANGLDYLNWRIGVYRDSDNPNAYSTNMNYVAISTSLYDTFENNDDALAIIIGHEMGHALLGHQQRSTNTLHKLEKFRRAALLGNYYGAISYSVQKRKYLIDSKNMEYAADVEGAKLASKAGYNLDKGADVLSFFNTLARVSEISSDHPDPKNRIKNFNDNRKYFMEDEWAEIGKYNIYNSDVLPAKLSSDRRSVVISSSPRNQNPSGYYRPETMEQLYARFGYRYYVNGEFSKSLQYFEKLFAIDHSNMPAYLYASYASEALYKNTGNSKYLNKAKEYANYAQTLEPNNKYVKEQIEAL